MTAHHVHAPSPVLTPLRNRRPSGSPSALPPPRALGDTALNLCAGGYAALLIVAAGLAVLILTGGLS